MEKEKNKKKKLMEVICLKQKNLYMFLSKQRSKLEVEFGPA